MISGTITPTRIADAGGISAEMRKPKPAPRPPSNTNRCHLERCITRGTLSVASPRGTLSVAAPRVTLSVAAPRVTLRVASPRVPLRLAAHVPVQIQETRHAMKTCSENCTCTVTKVLQKEIPARTALQ